MLCKNQRFFKLTLSLPPFSGIVAGHARGSIFTFRNRDELPTMHAADCCLNDSLAGDATARSDSEKRVFSDKLVDVA
jgi:hypothetical protein